LQYSESFRIKDPEHFFHGSGVFGNVFEDVVSNEDIEGVIFEWEISRIGKLDRAVDVAIEAGTDVYRCDLSDFVNEPEEMFFR
jgi:hypothetical protein